MVTLALASWFRVGHTAADPGDDWTIADHDGEHDVDILTSDQPGRTMDIVSTAAYVYGKVDFAKAVQATAAPKVAAADTAAPCPTAPDTAVPTTAAAASTAPAPAPGTAGPGTAAWYTRPDDFSPTPDRSRMVRGLAECLNPELNAERIAAKCGQRWVYKRERTNCRRADECA